MYRIGVLLPHAPRVCSLSQPLYEPSAFIHICSISPFALKMDKEQELSIDDKDFRFPPEEYCSGCDCFIVASAEFPCRKCEEKVCQEALCLCCCNKKLNKETKKKSLDTLHNVPESPSKYLKRDEEDPSTSDLSQPPEEMDSTSSCKGSVAFGSDACVTPPQRPAEPAVLHVPAEDSQSVCEGTSQREVEEDRKNVHNVPSASALNTATINPAKLRVKSATYPDVTVANDRAYCGGCQCLLAGNKPCIVCVRGRCSVALYACCCEEACIVTFCDPSTGHTGLFIRRGIASVVESGAQDSVSSYEHEPAAGANSSSVGFVPIESNASAPLIQTHKEPLPLHMAAPEDDQCQRKSTTKQAEEDQRNVKHGSIASAPSTSETKYEDSPTVCAAATEGNTEEYSSQFCPGCIYDDLKSDDCVACEGMKLQVASCPCCRKKDSKC